MFSHEDALFLGLRAAFRPRGGAGGERRRGGACGAGVVSPACPPDSSRHAEDVTGEKTPFRLERDGETPRDERDKKRARRKSVLSPGRTGRSPGNGPGRATCRNADAPPVRRWRSASWPCPAAGELILSGCGKGTIRKVQKFAGTSLHGRRAAAGTGVLQPAPPSAHAEGPLTSREGGFGTPGWPSAKVESWGTHANEEGAGLGLETRTTTQRQREMSQLHFKRFTFEC